MQILAVRTTVHRQYCFLFVCLYFCTGRLHVEENRNPIRNHYNSLFYCCILRSRRNGKVERKLHYILSLCVKLSLYRRQMTVVFKFQTNLTNLNSNVLRG